MPNTATHHPAMPRAIASARNKVVTLLKEDHRRVRRAARDFSRLSVEDQPELCRAIVEPLLAALTVHSALEEELLYPAARTVLDDPALIDAAEIEHGSARALIDQLRGMQPGDDKYAARFTVLCEYVLHHIKVEESELFPKLRALPVDWEELAARFDQRRQALMTEHGVTPPVPRSSVVQRPH
ncbi:MAG: hemerythrin domain-containing protein [Burkholderiales bacterium]